MRRLVLVVVLLTACGTAVPRAATVTPSPATPAPTTLSWPSPTPSRSDFLAVVGGPKNSSVSLVESDGTVVARAPVDVPKFQMHALMSWTSASRTRLYYLDGSEVRFLGPNGISGLATRIALGATEQAGLSVSPDDARIAVAVFSYTQLPAGSYNGMRLYVEDLHGGGHHADIFSSTTVAEFPVGWTGGRLILAVTEPRCCTTRPINPYDAISYHVVDPATGTRLAIVCRDSQGPRGPIEPLGAICYYASFPQTYIRWDGSPFEAPGLVPGGEYLSALSPDGRRVAVGGLCDCTGLGQSIWLWGRNHEEALLQPGYVLGWLDDHHIVIQHLDSPMLAVIEISEWWILSNSVIALDGSYLGTFPAAVV